MSCNPLLKRGEKFHSQNDEDGIISAILKRILNIDSGVFVEYGCGDGLENNTIPAIDARLEWGLDRSVWT